MTIKKLREILVQYNMSENFIKRIFTSIALLILLFIIMINNLALGVVLMILGIFSLLEFFNISHKIFKKKKIKKIYI